MKEIKIIPHGQIQNALAAHYAKLGGWVVLTELRDGTGLSSYGREADVVALQTWPSRGMEIIGHEVKSQRGDWLHELKQPEKAESIAKFCDAWYLVTGPGITRLEEIPAAWGWRVYDGRKFTTMKAAPEKEPMEISRVFLASLVRNIEKNYRPAAKSPTIQAMAEDLAKEKVEQAIASSQRQNETMHREYGVMREALDKFEKASGLDLRSAWGSHSATEVGAAVGVLLNRNGALTTLKRLLMEAEQIKSMMALLDSMDAAKKQAPIIANVLGGADNGK